MKKHTTTITIDLETSNIQVIQHLINRIKKTKFKNILNLKITNTTPNSTEIPDDEKTTRRHKLLKLRSNQRKILKTIIAQLDFKPTSIDYEPDIGGYQAGLHHPHQPAYNSPVSITVDDNISKIAVTSWNLAPGLIVDLADPTFIEQINKRVNAITKQFEQT